MPSVVMLSVIMLNVTDKHYVLSVIMLNVILLSVVAPKWKLSRFRDTKKIFFQLWFELSHKKSKLTYS